MTLIALALGSNLGDRAANLQSAVDGLAAGGVAITALSSVWETPPIPADQPQFLNAALAGDTSLSPTELLALCKRIERALGRRPARRWGPRPCDIDILFYGHQVVDTPALTIPHRLIASRAFVLAPLSEVLAGPLPVLGIRALDLLAKVDAAGQVRTPIQLRAGS